MAGQFRKIATEEAFSIPEVAEALKSVARTPGESLDLQLVRGIYDQDPGYGVLNFLGGLLDMESERLRDMDRNGVDMHLLSLTAPGVQMFDSDSACELATLANDRLAEVIARHPRRFAGLATCAPHAPKRAAREMERAIGKLKLNGFIVNSHTHGEYFDNPKFWPILETAEALDRCIYIHPRAASDTFKGPLQHYGMDSAMWGYGVEVGTHVVRMMASGVFDRFPKLKICIGHMGEAVHFWLWRLTFMNFARAEDRPGTEDSARRWRNTSGAISCSPPAAWRIRWRSTIRSRSWGPTVFVLWAIDYPYLSRVRRPWLSWTRRSSRMRRRRKSNTVTPSGFFTSRRREGRPRG